MDLKTEFNTEKLMTGKNINIEKEFPQESFDVWKEKVIKDLKGKPFDSLKTETYEGITLSPLYDFEGTKKLIEKIPYPSQINFRRGFKASGYSLKDWEIAQGIYLTSPKAFNETALHDLRERINSVSVKINGLNGKLLRDKFSLQVKSYNDFKTAFHGIDFSRTPVHLAFSSDYLKFYDYLKRFSDEEKISAENFRGSFTADPVSTFITAGKLPQSELNDDSLKFADYVKVMSERFPPARTIGVDASIYGAAGANAVQELAFAIATGVEYFNFLNDKLSNETIAKKIKFSFSIGANFFMEITKLRAFRILWDSVLAGFGVKEKIQRVLVEVRSSQFTQTFTEPYSNMLRVTTEAMAGVIGGADLIHVAPFNVGFEIPDEFSRRIAANVQIIIREETSVREVIDAAAGSYYVETLTDELVSKAWTLFQSIEENGGMIKSLKKGIPQKLIAEVRERKIADLKKRKLSLIGTNVYVKNSGEIPEEVQPEKTADTAFTNSWDEIEPFDFSRASEIFEELLKSVNNYAMEHGNFPGVEGIAVGKISDYKPRADFSRALFETAAFKMNLTPFENLRDAEETVRKSSRKIILLASTDKIYLDSISQLKNLIASNKTKTFVIAGRPPEVVPELQNFKNLHFIFAGMNVYDFLKKLFETKFLSKENV